MDEGTWTAARALRKFSQLTFAYGVSAVFAGVSAGVMSLPGGPDWLIVAAVLPFVVSLVISSYILTDLLEFVWDGLAGRFVERYGPAARLWATSLLLLITGALSLAAGVALAVLAFGMAGDFGYLTPFAVVLFAICGLTILVAVVLPAAALGPPRGRWLAAAAAGLGVVGVSAEAAVTVTLPMGSNPFLGWMEGTFPLLNWNLGFAALVAASAFLIWMSYRYVLPAAPPVTVPA